MSNKMQFVTAVIGGSLIMSTLGTNYCLGGLAPYIVSRLLASNDSAPAREYANTGGIVWVFVMAALFQGIGMLASGFLAVRLSCDRRWSILAGCLLSSLGTCLSGVTVEVSLGLVILTSGAIFGLGQGFAYALILESVTSWTDDRKGLVTGILVSSFAAGAVIFLPIQSKIINPDNLTPNWRIRGDRLFSQPDVTSRTPHSFYVMSAVYACVQVACVGLVARQRSRSKTNDDDAASNSSGASEVTMLISAGSNIVPIPEPMQPQLQQSPLSSMSQRGTAVDASSDAPIAWTLRQAMTSLPFIIMGASIFFLTPASIVLPSLDKAYGETFISNDMLLSVLAGVAGVFNAIGRLAAGAVIDRVHFRVCVLTQGLILAVLHAVTPLSSFTHPALYFSLVCLINFVFAGMFVFFPYAVERQYGSALLPQVYGLVYFFKAVSGALIAIVTTSGLWAFGWSGVMLLTAATSAVGGLIIVLFNSDTWRVGLSLG